MVNASFSRHWDLGPGELTGFHALHVRLIGVWLDAFDFQ